MSKIISNLIIILEILSSEHEYLRFCVYRILMGGGLGLVTLRRLVNLENDVYRKVKAVHTQLYCNNRLYFYQRSI